MKALILIGGFGTRLEPLTITTPKSMVPVINAPFLEYLLKRLKNCGIREVVFSLGHLPAAVLEYFGDGQKLGLHIEYVVEESPLGTGGGIKNAERYLDETFLVINGDVFTDIDIKQMEEFHAKKRAMATIALIPVEDPSRYGIIDTGTDGRVRQFIEKPSGKEITTNLINAGLIIMETQVLDYIPADTPYSYEKQLFPALLRQGEPVFGYSSRAYWIDIGTPESYFRLNADLLAGKSNQYTPTDSSGCFLDPASTIADNVVLEGNVVVGQAAVLGKGSGIKNSLIWPETTIGEDCEIEGSIIADRCRIGSKCRIQGTVLGSGIVLGDKQTLLRNSRVYPNSKIY